jgi:hypothetical protein
MEENAMKRTMAITAVAVALVVGSARPAQAINKEWSAVAGFVGGVLVANAAHGNRGYSREVVYTPSVRHVTVYHEPAPSGHWEWQHQRVWVPGCWIYENRGCGARRKIWQPGYYRVVKTKVWVTDVCYNGGGW